MSKVFDYNSTDSFANLTAVGSAGVIIGFHCFYAFGMVNYILIRKIILHSWLSTVATFTRIITYNIHSEISKILVVCGFEQQSYREECVTMLICKGLYT